jgi:hypothetical protein
VAKINIKGSADPQPYAAALSLVTGVLSLVISASYAVDDSRGWMDALGLIGFGVLAVLNLSSFMWRIVPWTVHTADRHRPTE